MRARSRLRWIPFSAEAIQFLKARAYGAASVLVEATGTPETPFFDAPRPSALSSQVRRGESFGAQHGSQAKIGGVISGEKSKSRLDRKKGSALMIMLMPHGGMHDHD